MVLDFTKYSDAELAQAQALGLLPAADGLRLEIIHYSVLRLTLQIRAQPSTEESALAEMDRILHGNRQFIAVLRRNAGDVAFPSVLEAFIRWGDRAEGGSEPRYRSFEDFLAREIRGSLMEGYPYNALRMVWDHATFRVPAPEDVYGWGFPTSPPPTSVAGLSQAGNRPGVGEADEERDDGGMDDERDELESEGGGERGAEGEGHESEDEVDRLFGQLSVGRGVSRFDETDVSLTPPPRPRSRQAPALVRVDSPLPGSERESESSGSVPSAPTGPRRIRLLPPRPAPSAGSSSLLATTEPPLVITLPVLANLRRQGGGRRAQPPPPLVPSTSASRRPLNPAGTYRGMSRLSKGEEALLVGGDYGAPSSAASTKYVARGCGFKFSHVTPLLPTPSLTAGSTAGSEESEFVYNGLLGPMGLDSSGSQVGLDSDDDQDEVGEGMTEEERRVAKRMGKRKAE
ncbi:hypothetical protein EIP91_011253 [Steccherinum ochraceum]|uniref:Uncharacterized protein n=1 Tax=Steccherinum ochraceum TaxID=92696 RepID=A0A4V2MX10_9APHY|nr:hypothetical protein EIP91_011253 [Steccherinum ochraceum]